jgi:hypothetical protein
MVAVDATDKQRTTLDELDRGITDNPVPKPDSNKMYIE